VASLAHVPDVALQPLTGTLHATASGRPQVDRAAQRTTLPLQRAGTSLPPPARFSAWATQRTYAPWLVAGSHGHVVSIAACAAQRAASQAALPWGCEPPPGGPPAAPTEWVDAVSHAVASNARHVLTLSSRQRSPGAKAARMPATPACMGRSTRVRGRAGVRARPRLLRRAHCGTLRRRCPARASKLRRRCAEMIGASRDQTSF